MFKSAMELDLDEQEYAALVRILELLEGGMLTHYMYDPLSVLHTMIHKGYAKGDGCFVQIPMRTLMYFNMTALAVITQCGVVCSMLGAAETLLGREFAYPIEDNKRLALRDLFGPTNIHERLGRITVAQAAKALRKYLTLGDAQWEQIIPSLKRAQGSV